MFDTFAIVTIPIVSVPVVVVPVVSVVLTDDVALLYAVPNQVDCCF